MSENEKIIFLVRDSQQTVNYTASAETIASLAQELGLTNYSAAVNGAVVDSTATFAQGDAVALIAKDKTGGNPSGTYVRTKKKKLGRPSKEDFQAGGFHLSKQQMQTLKAVAAFEGKTMDAYASDVMHTHIKNVQIKITLKRS